MGRWNRWAFACLLTLSFTVVTAWAQDARGTLLGRVTDASGATIAEATVAALNTATGVKITAKTNESGNYTLPYLIPGVYTITVENTGFKRFVQENIQVRINDTVEVNAQMELGAASEAVVVKAETPLLSTAEASLGQVVDEKRISELPLFAGNAMDLVHLAPGTVNGTNLRSRKAPFNNAPSQFATDGGGNYNNEFTIDGVPNIYSDGTQPRVAFSPPQMSVAEFRVQTSPFDASVGHTFGSVVNVSTKSGTNALHGEAHEWIRNRVFDAPTIFQNRSGQKLGVYQDNRYGLSGGAPVYIPKLYNGKNRTFWFYAWEANKFGDPSNAATSTVPTEAMRRGDLSALLALGPQYQIYDPATTVSLGNGRYQRQPFPNNIIPESRIDPVAKRILAYWPLPNQRGTAEGRNNYFNGGKALEDYWTHLFRIDHSFSEKHRIFLRGHRDYWQEDKNRYFNDNTTGIILNRINRGIAFDDVYVFSSTFLANFRYGITAQEFPEQRVSRGFDLASLGFGPSVLNNVNPVLATFPNVQVGSFTQLSQWESGDGSTSSTIHSITGAFTKLQANHSIRFGPEFRVEQEYRNRYNLDVSPQLIFDSSYTRGPLDTSAAPALGGEIASFLLGIPSTSGGLSRTASYAESDKFIGLFVQDDWKVTRKLTLNLGIRYEYETPMTERFNRAALHFAFDQSNPIEAAARAAYARNPLPELPVEQFRVLGGLTFANANGNPRGYWNSPKTNFLPRFGLAYQIMPKTVMRAGYGIYYNSLGVTQANTLQTGFSITTPIQASLDNGLTFVANTANPFPNGLLQPLGASGGLATNLGQNISFYPVDRKAPYAQRWSLGFQQEIALGWVLEASYVGNRGTRLNIQRELNGVPLQYLSRSATRDQERITFLGQQFPNPFVGLSPVYTSTISRSQLLKPYPEFNSVTTWEPIGYSWYHSLQARGEKRFSHGYTVQFSYTWSKAMEATQFLNDADPRPTEVISQLDRTHRLTGSGIWELPFGRGRLVGAQWGRTLNFLAGGWQLNGLVQKQSGEPLAFGNRIFNGDLGNVLLPNDQRSVDQWFNVNAGFNRNSAQQLASNYRQFPLRFSGIRGPGQSRWDFSVFKNFKTGEHFTTQFRAECYNAFNHPNLANPNTDPTSSAFGTITSQDPPRSWQLALKLSF